jgi:RimJ/RimL family protein N-acetyltransferase
MLPDPKNVILTKNRIILRQLTVDDVTQNYVDWMNDPVVNEYLESRSVTHSMETVIEFVSNMHKSREDILFGIFFGKNEKHIGNIKLGQINEYQKSATIGLAIGDKDFWGKGIATMAISLVTNYGFMDLELEKICAGCYEHNLGSKKAFLKTGYQVEGFLKNQVKTVGGREGVWQMGVSLSEILLDQ